MILGGLTVVSVACSNIATVDMTIAVKEKAQPAIRPDKRKRKPFLSKRVKGKHLIVC